MYALQGHVIVSRVVGGRSHAHAFDRVIAEVPADGDLELAGLLVSQANLATRDEGLLDRIGELALSRNQTLEPGEARIAKNDAPEKNASTYAAAPVDTIRALFEAFAHSRRDAPGFTLIAMRLDAWRAWIPLSELYGLLDRLKGS